MFAWDPKTCLDFKKFRNKMLVQQGGIFHLLHEKLQAGWKENLKNLSEHALLLGTSNLTVQQHKFVINDKL